MKNWLLIITISLFGIAAVGTLPAGPMAIAQKKDKEEKKKDPPGPPVVKDKGGAEKPKESPKKDKRPS
jgi:hypothetical protein